MPCLIGLMSAQSWNGAMGTRVELFLNDEGSVRSIVIVVDNLYYDLYVV